MRPRARARIRALTASGPDQDASWIQLAVIWAWRLAVAGFCFVILFSVLALQAAHVDDKQQTDMTSGVFFSLSRSASSGHLYPPLFDGTHYGGTRYMPVPILVPAALYRLTGNLVLSEKLGIYLFSFLLFGLVFLVLRRLDCPRLVSLALIAATLATSTGLIAAVGVRWDAPALFFQLAALAVVHRSWSTRALAFAALLCALAFAAKLNAVWAAAAIAGWVLLYARKRLWVFLATLAVSLAAVMGALELASSGRLSKNILTLAFAAYQKKRSAEEGPSGFGHGLTRLTLDFPYEARVILFLLPFASLAILYGALRRRLTVFQLALIAAAAVLWGTYYDTGASANHLIDVSVLTIVVVGGLLGELQAGPGRLTWIGAPALAAAAAGAYFDSHAGREVVALLVAITAVTGITLALALRRRSGSLAWLGAAFTVVLISQGSSFYRDFVFAETKVALKTLAGQGDNRYSTHPLAGVVGVEDHILSEDSYIDASLGRQPVVLDEWSFNRLVRIHPDWAALLAKRVAAREFDKIVLVSPIELEYLDGHFGPVVNRQIRRYYRLVRTIKTAATGTYWIYVPRSPPRPPLSPARRTGAWTKWAPAGRFTRP